MTSSLHCIPIQVTSMAELDERIRAEADHADLLEVWLDSIRDLRLAEIFFTATEIKTPLLFVNKASEEGGDFMGTPEARVEFLLEALERGADYVDVALSTDPKLIKKLVQQRDAKEPKAKLILSYHNFKETPPVEDLQKIVQDAHKQGADMVKIATFIKDVSENVVLLDLLKWATETKIPLIVIGMGDKGNLTRVIAPLLGSPLYYAPMDEDTATAPGQLTKMDLDSIWGHLNS